MLILDFDEDDLPTILPLEHDEEVKLEPKETIAKRIKSNSQKRKTTGTGLKTMTTNKLLTSLPTLLSQKKSGNNLCKSKNYMRQTLRLLYQPNRITKKAYNNLIYSL